MNKKSQLQFAHRCSILLDAGISLTEALSVMINLEKSKKNLKLLQEIRGNVERGISFSKSILLVQKNFNSTLVSMISHGESSGILPLSIQQAREVIEKGAAIKKKLVGALIYPGFIAMATAAMTLFLVMFIFPKIIPLFSSMNIRLPLITRMVQMLHQVLFQYGLTIIGMLLLCGIIFSILFKKKKAFRSKFQTFFLRSPGIGVIIQKYFLSTQCRSIGTLLECGQDLPSILVHTVSSSTLEPYRDAWEKIRTETLRGLPLSTSLRLHKNIFPTLVPDMLSIGERTGSLASMFQHISRIYEEELESFIRQLSTSIEPILMIAMGLIVGSVALSIILPIYEITNHLTK